MLAHSPRSSSPLSKQGPDYKVRIIRHHLGSAATGTSSSSTTTRTYPREVHYVDRGTGASPVPTPAAPPPPAPTTAKRAAPTARSTSAPTKPPSSSSITTPSEPTRSIAELSIKRHASDSSSQMSSNEGGGGGGSNENNPSTNNGISPDDTLSPSKRPRPADHPRKIVPHKYEDCDTKDLVLVISSMLLELISFNDSLPLKDGHLTRFHSRSPPSISVEAYLQRISVHATLSPPILLSIVYYIDRLCALYPAFTITSLTVHRFLIVSATVASKGLSDSFWTNKTYARVGGVSIKELALLELEFLTRLDWRIVPKPEVLVDYYKSLVKRSETHRFEKEDEPT